ncbi:MAG: type secretion system protein [Verrucomicrobia bacterium]|nr:type secretion system protein [Verrucomicrobiota bacterium]
MLTDDCVLRRALDEGGLSEAQLASARTKCSRQGSATVDSSETIGRLVADGALSARQVAQMRADSAEVDQVNVVSTGMLHDSDGPVIRMVNEVIADAIRRRASDVHWEPLEKRFRVRCRIDGVLVETHEPAQALQKAILSRLKIMANISIAEKRIPQDGRIQLSHRGRPIDLRVSSLPTAHGESVVMRVLDQAALSAGLGDLGLEPEDRSELERLIALPDGVVLVTGPTGSGKTSTLYGCLQHLNRSNRKIITVEDPVEYQLNGINQVPVRAGIGLTFAAALRAMLRQAPNVVMVGEIRDRETAEIAVNASLTGHMVLSTLHTNDAPGAITRLVDLGIKPFLLAASVRAVIAQRLVRRICASCARTHQPSEAELRALDLSPEQLSRASFRTGAGCPGCDGTGFHGRVGLFEIVVINAELQEMIHARAPAALLRAKARSLGMRTLREDGARKVSAGLTTAAEVVSITAGEPSQPTL